MIVIDLFVVAPLRRSKLGVVHMSSGRCRADHIIPMSIQVSPESFVGARVQEASFLTPCWSWRPATIASTTEMPGISEKPVAVALSSSIKSLRTTSITWDAADALESSIASVYRAALCRYINIRMNAGSYLYNRMLRMLSRRLNSLCE